MSMTKVLVGFVPWIVFSLVATRVGPGAVGVAAVLAFLVALGLVIRSVVRGESPKLLELAGAAVFLAFAVVALTAPVLDAVLASYGRAIAALVLALIIFALLPIMPFTEQYARESVPRQYWHTPEFRAVNRRISAAWGGVVAVMALGHAIAGTFEVPDPGAGLLHRPVDLVFNWVVPALLVWWAARYTQRVSAAAGSSTPAPARQSSPR
ncbi:hypothetical protein LQ327_25755 [Actinomycetospora endophytica]|uniref:Intracellular septation protein A n=1 Tax=Actinomycetospora endophytica TaxID=2291215 RepID=A0ABS8PHB4_9PSEU|nr:hypothetical protein [Actinomycetospora endophytica]MCD2196781.1 hypothetical protein [Actinomycetospora endophytica]